jgi:hypothetical protein
MDPAIYMQKRRGNMKRLILVLVIVLFSMAVSYNVFADSPFHQINQRLDTIEQTLDQIILKLDEDCDKTGVPKTGQTTFYALGDDGDLQMGIAWPEPRFTDNEDGTVTDNLNGLMWTKDAQQIPGRMT